MLCAPSAASESLVRGSRDRNRRKCEPDDVAGQISQDAAGALIQFCWEHPKAHSCSPVNLVTQ